MRELDHEITNTQRADATTSESFSFHEIGRYRDRFLLTP